MLQPMLELFSKQPTLVVPDKTSARSILSNICYDKNSNSKPAKNKQFISCPLFIKKNKQNNMVIYESDIRRIIRRMLLKEESWRFDEERVTFPSTINIIVTYPEGDLVKIEPFDDIYPELQQDEICITITTTLYGKISTDNGDGLYTPPSSNYMIDEWDGEFEIEGVRDSEGSTDDMVQDAEFIMQDIKATHREELAKAFEDYAER